MRVSLILLVTAIFAAAAQAQTGPCTETAIKEGRLPVADNAFSFMPPFGKPVTGKAAIHNAAAEKFADRINRKYTWADDHKIVISPSGDMAYEHGTMHVSYDTKSDGQHHEFSAVMLTVYKANGDACQQVAGTMHPLEDTVKP
jgi:ketosteroid isomerase-like protein